MPSEFAGSTANHYRRFRRDVPNVVVDAILQRLRLGDDAVAVDLGAGTGQVAVPLADRIATVWAVDPEPAMLVLLRERTLHEAVDNVLCVLASDRDLGALIRGLGEGRCDLVTIANALHWMDAPEVFGACHRLLRPGGGVAVITHGVPLWLAESDRARNLRGYLEAWTGQRATSHCGSDETARREREEQLRQAGFAEVTVWEHRYQAVADPDYIIGHLYSAMTESMVPASRRPEFEAGVRVALEPFADAPLVEEVPVTVLIGRR